MQNTFIGINTHRTKEAIVVAVAFLRSLMISVILHEIDGEHLSFGVRFLWFEFTFGFSLWKTKQPQQ